MIFYQASKLSFSVTITILYVIFQAKSFNAEINKCHGSCKTSNFSNSLPYPFGFSAGCPIQLNCTETGVTIGKFVVLNITSTDIVIKLPAKCDREVASISVLFGENYALSSATSLLLENCSKPLSGPCEIRPMFIEGSLKLNSCAARSDNMSCFNGAVGENLLSFDEINNTQCRFLFSATTAVASNSAVSLELERVYLGWWHKGEYCNCDQNANCTQVMKGNSTVMGYRCSCKEGYEGDGFKEGSGCRRVLRARCNFHHYMSGKCGGRGSERVVVAVAIGGVCLGFGLLFLIHKQYRFLVHKRLKKKFFESNGGLLLQQQISSDQGNIGKTKIFTLKELETATDHFNENRVLGKGGQGTVFQGLLVDGRNVAVKRSKLVDKDKIKEFVNEIVILSQIDHRNVVKLVGCCLETQVPLLVYEFVPNGTLFQYLHDQQIEFPLTWEMRVRIASEAAGAISYLHSVASIPIYHRDIKSTNILLDDKYRAKVSDFGTSKTIAIDQSHVTTLVYGTMGYLDPEYFQTSQFTEKSDVYSFGVVLAELLTGKSPVSLARSGEDRSLATYFVVSMEQDQLFDILDVRLILDNCCSSEIVAVAGVAKKCLSLNGKDRPTMKEVAMELEKVQQLRKNMNAQLYSEEGIEYFGELDLLEISPI